MWEFYRDIIQSYPKIYQSVFPHLIPRFGEDLLTETTLILYEKIDSYNLDYHDKQGNPNPVKFVSYVWKRIDGFIIDYLRKEINKPTVPYDETRM